MQPGSSDAGPKAAAQPFLKNLLSPISLIHITHYLSHGSGPEAQYLVPY